MEVKKSIGIDFYADPMKFPKVRLPVVMVKNQPRALLFVVAYNEEKNLGALIAEIREKVRLPGWQWDLVVVDDGSSDGSGRVAAGCGARVLRHPVNLGIGAAEMTGLLFARKRGYDLAVRMDGDGQHPPEGVADLVAAVAEGKAHLSIGSRFVDGSAEGSRSTFLRRIGIGYFSLLCFLLTGKRIKDPTSGFRCFARESIEALTAVPAQDYPEVESFIDASRWGLRVLEVPSRFRERRGGASSIRLVRSVYFMIKVTLAILVASIRARPVREHRGEA
jgi:glycosyltransferase involved in cell wall biosynthesis